MSLCPSTQKRGFVLAVLLTAGLDGRATATLAQGRFSQRVFTAQNCQLQSGGESTVIAIAGPQTLHLADGRFVRLIEIYIPSTQAVGFDPSAAAVRYLNETALGRKVEVKFGGAQRDRYGVALGQVFVSGERPLWLQEGLVASGFAEVYPQPDNHACSQLLLAKEAAARDEHRGHWGLAYFKVLQAGDTRLMFNLAQTYQIVEGKAGKTAESGGRLTLRFGDRSKYPFTAVMDAAARKRFADKQSTDDWEGVDVRVRGWLDHRRGPSIAIAVPEQIEIIHSKNENGPDANRAGR